MNVFYNYYQLPNMASYYNYIETLYPDFNTCAAPSDLNSPYQIYNLDLSTKVDANGYYVYRPANVANNNNYQERPEPNNRVDSRAGNRNTQSSSLEDLEAILRKNPDVWKAYQTGRYSVREYFENGHRKIVLKERGQPETEYSVRKFKVHVGKQEQHDEYRYQHHQQQPQVIQHNQQPNDDHILLVSFSNSSIQPTVRCHQVGQDNHVEYVREDYHIDPQYNLTGPGTDLVNRLVNDDYRPESRHFRVERQPSFVRAPSVRANPEDQIIYQEQRIASRLSQRINPNSVDPYEAYYGVAVQPSQSVISQTVIHEAPAHQAVLETAAPETPVLETTQPAEIEPVAEEVHEEAVEELAEDAADEPEVAEAFDTEDQEQVEEVEEEEVEASAEEIDRQYQAALAAQAARAAHLQQQSAQFAQEATQSMQAEQAAEYYEPSSMLTDSPVSRTFMLSDLQKVRNSQAAQALSHTEGSLSGQYLGSSSRLVRSPYAPQNFLRTGGVANIRKTPNQFETQSIGPGSLAGGSIFGGYMPSQYETISQKNSQVNEKSAFSGYNFSKNLDGLKRSDTDNKEQYSTSKSRQFEGVKIAY